MADSKVPAADATLRILSHLAAQRGPIAAASIAGALHLPRSTVYHLLGVLQDRGFVVHLPEARRFGLGVAAFELSGGFARQQPLSRLGHPLLADLVDRVGESAHLAVMHGRDVLYIVEERAPRRPHLVTDVGVRLPAHLTASGRAMLAGMPRGQVRALFPDAASFVDRTGIGPTRYSELRRLLDAVPASGVATEDGEVSPGMASVAVAVPDHVGWPAAAVAVTFPAGTASDAVVREVSATAADLARRIRGRT
ncbi:DNA-binding IclR family transcriptional regulator [Mycetocola sp. CAN_C7]|uniref:IclR family transcriptional regulator n=1 Tax=Mycetocola sp. CAN_C7 TaxID=2787724 RepID=UPI0018CB43ED